MKLCAIPASDLKVGMSICSQATMLMGEPIAAMRKIVKIKPDLTYGIHNAPALGIETDADSVIIPACTIVIAGVE